MGKLEDICVQKGMKMTGQRRIIARVLSEAADHPDVEKVYQTTPNSNVNGITKESSQLNSYENRLDKNTLSSLKNNPFNIQVNPI